MATYPKLISDKKNPLKASDWFEKANDEVQFAYWVPNVSGGLVITMLPMDTDRTSCSASPIALPNLSTSCDAFVKALSTGRSPHPADGAETDGFLS